MNSTPNTAPSSSSRKPITVKMVALGGAGARLAGPLSGAVGFDGLHRAWLYTSPPAAGVLPAEGERLHLESKILRGLGTGGDPDRGRAAAEEHLPKLRAICEGVDVVMIVAGLGGGTGTGVAPVLARIAREAGALVLAFVTLPFDCEGARRQRLARQGLEQIKAAADGVICLPNQKAADLLDESTTVVDTFRITNEQLVGGIRGVWQILTQSGLLDVNFDDLSSVMRGRHSESSFAAAEAAGAGRAQMVVEKLLVHPMFDGGQALGEASAVLVSLVGGADLTMKEVTRVMEQINRRCEPAQIIVGAAIDPDYNDRLSVTMIVSSRQASETGASGQLAASTSDSVAPELETQLLQPGTSDRRISRFVAPAPELTQETREALLARQSGLTPRQRRKSARMSQGQLPLEVVSKGRFEKSEPTIHKGEDLDVPTYIRRGVPLN